MKYRTKTHLTETLTIQFFVNLAYSVFGLYTRKEFAFLLFFRKDRDPSSLGPYENLRQIFSRTEHTLRYINTLLFNLYTNKNLITIWWKYKIAIFLYFS